MGRGDECLIQGQGRVNILFEGAFWGCEGLKCVIVYHIGN